MAKEVKTQKKNRIHIGNRFADALLVVFFIFASIIFIYPFLNVIAVSLSSNTMITTGQVTWFPKEFNTVGYKLLFEEGNIWRAYLNTVIVCLGFAVVNLSLTSLLAYVMMVPDFVLKKPISALLLITMFFSGGMIPSYLVVKELGLMDTMWAIVLPVAINTYNMIIIRTSFQSLPESLFESAQLDGANDFTILFRIALPLSKAVLATMVLFYSVSHWNSYFSAMLYLDSKDKYPLQIILRNKLISGLFSEEASQSGGSTSFTVTDSTLRAAVIMFTTLPILVVYPFVQKYFVKGVMIGSLKG